MVSPSSVIQANFPRISPPASRPWKKQLFQCFQLTPLFLGLLRIVSLIGDCVPWLKEYWLYSTASDPALEPWLLLPACAVHDLGRRCVLHRSGRSRVVFLHCRTPASDWVLHQLLKSLLAENNQAPVYPRYIYREIVTSKQEYKLNCGLARPMWIRLACSIFLGKVNS